MQQQEQTNDTIIFTKSTKVGVDSKGREMISLILNEEQTKTLLEVAGGIQSRAKLQIHIGQGDYGPTAFFYLKEVQEAPANRASAPKKAGSLTAAGTRSQLDALKKAK